MNEALFHELALTLRPGIGPQLTRQLMSYGGSARNVLVMPAGRLRRIPGARDMLKQKGPQLKEKIDVVQSLEKVRAFLVSLKKEVEAAGKADAE